MLHLFSVPPTAVSDWLDVQSNSLSAVRNLNLQRIIFASKTRSKKWKYSGKKSPVLK